MCAHSVSTYLNWFKEGKNESVIELEINIAVSVRHDYRIMDENPVRSK